MKSELQQDIKALKQWTLKEYHTNLQKNGIDLYLPRISFILLKSMTDFKFCLAYQACKNFQVFMEENVEAFEFFLLLSRPRRQFVLKKKGSNFPLAKERGVAWDPPWGSRAMHSWMADSWTMGYVSTPHLLYQKEEKSMRADRIQQDLFHKVISRYTINLQLYFFHLWHLLGVLLLQFFVIF